VDAVSRWLDELDKAKEQARAEEQAEEQARTFWQRLCRSKEPKEPFEARVARLVGMTEREVEGYGEDFTLIAQYEQQKQIEDFQRAEAEAQKATAEAKPEKPPLETIEADEPEPSYGDWDETAITKTFPISTTKQAIARAVTAVRAMQVETISEWLDEYSKEDVPENWIPKPKDRKAKDRDERESFEMASRYNRKKVYDLIKQVWDRMLQPPSRI
jgi:hypothetical protein